MIFKMKSTEKNEFVASPATTGARLYSLMLALCLPADKNQKKSQKVLCKSAHETETRVARPPEQINVHISIFWIPQIGMEESQYFFLQFSKVKTELDFNLALKPFSTHVFWPHTSFMRVTFIVFASLQGGDEYSSSGF